MTRARAQRARPSGGGGGWPRPRPLHWGCADDMVYFTGGCATRLDFGATRLGFGATRLGFGLGLWLLRPLANARIVAAQPLCKCSDCGCCARLP